MILELDHKPLFQILVIHHTKKIDWRTEGVINPVSDSNHAEITVAVDTINSFSAIIEGRMVSLSTQQIIDCAGTIDSLEDVFKYIVDVGGLMSSSDYPNTEKKGHCRFEPEMIMQAVVGYQNVPIGESNLVQAVTNQGPVGACVDTSTWNSYSGGILNRCGTDINHCVQVVGYDDDADAGYWIAKNNWGRNWGEAGYIRIEMGFDLCLISDAAIYPILK